MNNLVKNIKTKLNKENVTWEEFKNELILQKNGIKEDEHLCLIYNDNEIRNLIIEKSTLKVIATQFNNIIYNTDAISILNNLENFDNVDIYECYEGTLIVVFYYNNKWYITTRRCLESNKSIWSNNMSYYDLFNEARKFDFDKLNKKYFYQFVLIHHKNRNIIDYSYLYEQDYKELVHIMTVDIDTMIEIDYFIDGCIYPTKYNFKTTDEMLNKLNEISENDKNSKRITSEGFVIKLNKFTTMKTQTDIYKHLFEMKPNNSNLYQIFVELYKNDNLNGFIEYFVDDPMFVIRKIHNSFKTICEEVLKLYYITRNKKNDKIYNSLKPSYKKMLYDIHGEYIRLKNLNKTKRIHITVHDVYKYLKKMETYELNDIFYDRMCMTNDKLPMLRYNNRCLNELTTLMFT